MCWHCFQSKMDNGSIMPQNMDDGICHVLVLISMHFTISLHALESKQMD